jgi:hypothetical protein
MQAALMRAAYLFAVILAVLAPAAFAAQEGVLIVDINNFATEHRIRGAADARADIASGNLAVLWHAWRVDDRHRPRNCLQSPPQHNASRGFERMGVASRQAFNACVPVERARKRIARDIPRRPHHS